MGADQKKAAAEGRIIVFIDETGLMLQPVVRRTWAPAGKTPVLEQWDRHDRTSVIAALAVRPDGSAMQLHFRPLRGNFKGPSVVLFLYALLRSLPGRLLVVWDRAPIHRSAEVREFLSAEPGRVHVEMLPGYAPDLNPVEHVWGHTKYAELANFSPHDQDELERVALTRLRRKRRRPGLLKSFFDAAGLRF